MTVQSNQQKSYIRKEKSPNRPSGRLLLTGLPILTAGAAAYAAVAADYMLNAPSLPTLPLGAMGDSLIGSAVILLLGALLLQKWQ